MPAKEIPSSSFYFEGMDKLVHFTMYLLLVYFWIAGMKRQNISPQLRKKAFYLGVIGAFTIGIFMEVIQHFYIKNRYFETLDLIANGIGCIFGVFLFRIIFKNSYS